LHADQKTNERTQVMYYCTLFITNGQKINDHYQRIKDQANTDKNEISFAHQRFDTEQIKNHETF